MKYSQVIDVNSFVDYFIINEYLQNYNAGFHSTYMYKDEKGKLKLGPLWENDSILGNVFSESYDPSVIAMQKAPLYEKLFRDVVFLDQLRKRYSKLRRGILSDAAVVRLIDDTAAYLGPARVRDWKRWESLYTAPVPLVSQTPDPEGAIIMNSSGSFDGELTRMKYLSVRHSSVVGSSMQRLTWEDDLFDTSYNTMWSSILVGLFVLVFMVAVRIGRHH